MRTPGSSGSWPTQALDKLDPEGSRLGKLLSPAKRRAAVEHVRSAGSEGVGAAGLPGAGPARGHAAPERPCPRPMRPALRQADDRAGQRVWPLRLPPGDGAAAAGEGWAVNHKRVERLWRREGLKVPAKQPKRGRLWLADGSCVRLRPAYTDHVWSYDFVADRTDDGRAFRTADLIDEYTRECLAIDVAREA